MNDLKFIHILQGCKLSKCDFCIVLLAAEHHIRTKTYYSLDNIIQKRLSFIATVITVSTCWTILAGVADYYQTQINL